MPQLRIGLEACSKHFAVRVLCVVLLPPCLFGLPYPLKFFLEAVNLTFQSVDDRPKQGHSRLSANPSLLHLPDGIGNGKVPDSVRAMDGDERLRLFRGWRPLNVLDPGRFGFGNVRSGIVWHGPSSIGCPGWALPGSPGDGRVKLERSWSVVGLLRATRPVAKTTLTAAKT